MNVFHFWITLHMDFLGGGHKIKNAKAVWLFWYNNEEKAYKKY